MQRLNEIFIDIFEKLSTIMAKKGEIFRSKAYHKAMETIINIQYDILHPDDLKKYPGIGKTIMEKMHEYVATGKIKLIEDEKLNPLNILTNVYGIGPKKAEELIIKGITSINQLRNNLHELNDKQIIGVNYFEDLLERIPRAEIEEFEKVFKKVADFIEIKYLSIVGSYRRGYESSGDIDVIITTDDPNKFITFINSLKNMKLITKILSRGPCKCLVIGKINSIAVSRRIDFLFTTQEEYPFSILYFTGSKIFNTVMRKHALQLGYTMNEHGLYKMDKKSKGDKVMQIFKEEKDIFNFLQLKYKEPIERIDGRSVEKI
jgi:DNA polymerase beta